MPTILPDSAMFWLTIRGSARLLRSALLQVAGRTVPNCCNKRARGVGAGAEQFVDLSAGIRQWLSSLQYLVHPQDIWMRRC
jgi:hypothetical protein